MRSKFKKIRVYIDIPPKHYDDLKLIHELRTTTMSRAGATWADTMRMMIHLGLKEYKKSKLFGQMVEKYKRIKSGDAGTTGTDHGDVLSVLIDTL